MGIVPATTPVEPGAQPPEESKVVPVEFSEAAAVPPPIPSHYTAGQRISVSPRCLDILRAAAMEMQLRGAVEPMEGLGPADVLAIVLEDIAPRISRTDWQRVRREMQPTKKAGHPRRKRKGV